MYLHDFCKVKSLSRFLYLNGRSDGGTSLYVPGILSIEGVQSFGLALNLEASSPISRHSIVCGDGHRLIKAVSRNGRLLRGSVVTEQHCITNTASNY